MNLDTGLICKSFNIYLLYHMPPEHLVLKSCAQSYWLKFGRILVEYRKIVAHFYYYITLKIRRFTVFLHLMRMGNRA